MLPALIGVPRQIIDPDRPALYFPVEMNGKTRWLSVTRRHFAENVLDLAAAFVALNLGPQQSIAMFCENRPEVLITHFAAWQLRAVTVSIYATATPEQVKFITQDAKINFILVDSQERYNTARQAGIQRIICVDPTVKFATGDSHSVYFNTLLELGSTAPEQTHNEVSRRAFETLDSDLATLLYTSGTTGEPKAAMLTHGNFTATFRQNHQRVGHYLGKQDTSLCFLPLSHIFELAWSCYCLAYSVPVYVNRDPKRIQQTMREVNPSCMCSVPRLWEKVYTVVMEKIEQMGAVSKALTKRALAVGKRRNLDYVRLGIKPPMLLEQEYQVYNGRVFRKLRKAIGVDNGKLFPTAGAPVADEIVEFCQSVGINMCVGYGLSETTATVSCFDSKNFVIGSVGTVLDGISVRIGDKNEIQVKAPSVMAGYYNRPEANAEAFTTDGWFRTGDAGRIDSDGNLFITDRIKDLFKTSNGKYIAPQAIESRLGADPIFEQVAIVGESRKFVTALIVPNYDELQRAATKLNLGTLTPEQMAQSPELNLLVSKRIEVLTADLAAYEHIKRFRLLPNPFTIARGELTNTLKMRRRVIYDHYADLIEELYRD